MAPSSGADPRLVASIRELLAARAAGKTICPSEAARAIGGDQWRDLMQPARDAARELVELGEVEVTQKGDVVDVTTARGPVRIRRAR
ncbi:S-adenosylmethionine tRNA ribosyltransferase [Rhodococcus sp. 06-1477-1B]|nr:S-adenosylmethionine tRNA ribosyltransferase [Rhodococcus sp. 06-1477-1B]